MCYHSVPQNTLLSTCDAQMPSAELPVSWPRRGTASPAGSAWGFLRDELAGEEEASGVEVSAWGAAPLSPCSQGASLPVLCALGQVRAA